VVTVKVRPSGPVQPVKVSEVMSPMGLRWPLPDFKVSVSDDDLHCRVVPPVFSLVVTPWLVTTPPGLMVQVVPLAARAAVPVPSASMAAAVLKRTVAGRLRMVIFLLIGMPTLIRFPAGAGASRGRVLGTLGQK
jgi:hypothetical protein